jgi:uncharacterized protein (DUF2147 family)
MLKICLGTMIALAAFTTAAMAASAPAEPTGEWAVEGDVAHVRVENCGGQLWGIVSWEKSPGTDSFNPDPGKRARPTLGMPILLGMAPAQPNRWDGEIYNSNDGKTYSAHISLTDSETLRVEGCVLGFLCGGQNWTRVDATASIKGAPKGNSIPSRSARAQAPGAKMAANSDVCSAAASQPKPASQGQWQDNQHWDNQNYKRW